ncbi:MAG: biotin/lipoyl-binding protein [Armatimonadota bacterium]|nr:biotin/lipoyl-binding protein [Armatimonadota bacterium]
MEFSLDTVRTVARLLQEANLAEISIEAATDSPRPCRLTVRRTPPVPTRVESGAATAPAMTVASTPFEVPRHSVSGVHEAPAPETPHITVTSTAVGIFRNSLPAHHLGEIVAAGQVIGIVESLKIPNEITAPVEGRVIEVLVEEGQGVEYGQPLVSLEPTRSEERGF